MQDAWVSPWWQSVLVPDEWDVCGISVPSLSVWHTFALENIGNKYLCGGPCSRDDAAGLLLFAKHDMAKGRHLMQPQFVNMRARESKAVCKIIDGIDFKVVNADCLHYVTTCTRSASRWEKQGTESKPSGAPYQFHIVRAVAPLVGSLEAAWNMAYPLARSYYDAYAEGKGDTTILSPEAQRLAESADQKEEVA